MEDRMKKLYFETDSLDKNAREIFLLTEDIMMENAASGIEKIIHKKTKGKPAGILILTGSGNNGGDGYVLARKLSQSPYKVSVFKVFEPKTEAAKLQHQRAVSAKVHFVPGLIKSDIIVDCIFGTGFHGEIPDEAKKIINKANKSKAFKIACDIPSGMDRNGTVKNLCFKSDITVTMGALKTALFLSQAKDYTGKIILQNLGISYENFTNNAPVTPQAFLLEKNDLQLPVRNKENQHKGNFGHALFISGEKEGASHLAGLSASAFGCGKVSILTEREINNFKPELMYTRELPRDISAIGIGMGLGTNETAFTKGKNIFSQIKNKSSLPIVLDADIFYNPCIRDFLLSHKKAILTPHPKEFAVLLKNTGVIKSFGNEFSISEILEDPFTPVSAFCNVFKDSILLLKGATQIISFYNKKENKPEILINPLGSVSLAKGGSGDILTGLICSLLAQNYKPLDAVTNASLALALASKKIKNTFALTPEDLIVNIKTL